ncbi:hypothetical protein EJB05_33230, partial [Eragrostis curvula]
MKIGPWGGTGGTPRDILQESKSLESITVRSTDNYGGRINGFSFVYVNYRGQSIDVGTWGSATKGYEDTIQMAPKELVIKVCGYVDKTGVRWLQFKTSTGRKCTYGWCTSSGTGKHFNVPLQQGGGGVLGFFGRADDSLVAIGVYVSGRNAFH